MQLQDGNEVPDGSEDGKAQDRVNMDPWVLPCAVGEALVLQHTSQWQSLSPEVRRSLAKEVRVVGVPTYVDDREDKSYHLAPSRANISVTVSEVEHTIWSEVLTFNCFSTQSSFAHIFMNFKAHQSFGQLFLAVFSCPQCEVWMRTLGL